MEPKKLTAKLGNWQETVAMNELMGDKVYDPRDRASGALTKYRCIAHSDQVDAKDYRSVLSDTKPPQLHRDYVACDEVGPREKKMRELIQAQIKEDEKGRQDSVDNVNNERFMVTTNQADFNGQSFSNSKLGAGSSSSSQLKKRDPYYVNDAPITYYLHTALHGKNFDFPATPIGDVNRIWLKGTSFTEGTNGASGYTKKSEIFENVRAPPTIRELQHLKKLRYDVVGQCATISPEGCRGAAVQTLTQKVLDLDNAAGRATVEAISEVVNTYTGVEITPEQQDALVIAFSRKNDERIILIEFIEFIRGSLSARGRDLVFRVWDACNPSNGEYVTEDDITQAVCSASPEATATILDSLHLYSFGDGRYDLHSLFEYYRDVYAEVGDDEDFEILINGTWRV